MDPYSDEAVQLYESLKDEGVVNQSALRLARIAGKKKSAAQIFVSFEAITNFRNCFKINVFD